MKLVFFRVDASIDIGTGHVMRCLALAEYIRKVNEVEVHFVCRETEGDLCTIIEKQGFTVHRIASNLFEPFNDANYTIEIMLKYKVKIDLLIIDHYGIDKEWEQKLKPIANKILVIDDLANRPHDCQILLDQNLFDNMEDRYKSLLPYSCKLFLGPKYVILRNEFYEESKHIRHRNGSIQVINVFMGGSDKDNLTYFVLKSLQLVISRDTRVDVIVGASNPHLSIIESFCRSDSRYIFYSQVQNISKLFNEADLAIGAGGSTTWERCFLGVPSMTIAVAENQIETTRAVGDFGATIYLGWFKDITKENIANAFEMLNNEPDKLLHMSTKAIELMGIPSEKGINQVLQSIF